MTPKTVYQAIGEDEQAESKLRAYALCDWGGVLTVDQHLGQVGGIKKAIRILKQSLEAGLLDAHLNQAFVWLGRIARYQGKWDEQVKYLEKARNYFDEQGDHYGVVHIYAELKRTNGRRGIWRAFCATHERGMDALLRIPTKPLALKVELLGEWAWAWALMGRYAESEQYAHESLRIARSLQDEFRTMYILRDLGWALGVQAKFTEAEGCFCESLSMAERLGRRATTESDTTMDQGVTLGFWGAILAGHSHFREAEDRLLESRKIKESLHAASGTFESLNWLGLASELQGEWEKASAYYRERTQEKPLGINYFECGALTGLVRVKHAQRTLPPSQPY